tara:strand:- start:12 stop:407 length:396 start_codon:yes stop_codon:yes gene_type:complete
MNKTIFPKSWFLFIPVFAILGLVIITMLPRNIPCLTVELFGHQCTFCGATRSFELFHQFNWIQSIILNPITFIILLFLWSLSFLYFLSYLGAFFNKIFHIINFFLNKFFLMVFGIIIMLYLLQYLFRIIFN